MRSKNNHRHQLTVSDSFSSRDVNKIMTTVSDSFMALRDGSCDPRDFDRLAGAFNIGVVRAEAIGDAALRCFQGGQAALLEGESKAAQARRYNFTPHGLEAMAKAVVLYSDLLKTSTGEQMKAALAEVERRIAGGYEAKLQPGVN